MASYEQIVGAPETLYVLYLALLSPVVVLCACVYGTCCKKNTANQEMASKVSEQSKRQCFKCGAVGHSRKECPSPAATEVLLHSSPLSAHHCMAV